MQEFLEKMADLAMEKYSGTVGSVKYDNLKLVSSSVVIATMEHVRDNVLFELSSKNAVDEAIRELKDLEG